MSFPRIELANLPTPMHRLDRVSADLGVEVFIKRDDLTALALGGNKARKLEYLMADALAKEAEVVVACGSVHSNFVRLLGAACAQLGLPCAAAAMHLPFEGSPPEGDRLDPDRGSPPITKLFGIDLRIATDGTWETLYEQAEALAGEYEARGKRVYRIPIGGSCPLGAYSFYKAADEVSQDEFDWIVFASSSGSTQTGLAHAFRGTKIKVLGICSDPEPDIANDFAKLAEGLADLIGDNHPLKAENLLLNFDFVGDGYGLPSQEAMDAIQYLARTEGILLDPIYSGKAFAALRSLVSSGNLTGKILFWHTGGTPNISALNGGLGVLAPPRTQYSNAGGSPGGTPGACRAPTK